MSVIGLFLLLSLYSTAVTTTTTSSNRFCEPHYTAAVLEMEDRSTEEALALVQYHADRARQAGVQLLVLPEYGLLSSRLLFQPQPRQILTRFAQELPLRSGSNVFHEEPPESHQYGVHNHRQQQDRREANSSCSDGSPTLLDQLSQIARTNSLYLVANLIERDPCEHRFDPYCPEDGQYLYNTNVVFDRQGVIIQHYRKFNLFGLELEILNREPKPSLAVFRTDFGVAFGMFTCFDILFDKPAAWLVYLGIRHFVFPTAWMDERPSLSGVQTHSGWARGLGVTLLTANQRNLGIGGVGSGVYGALGPINYTCDFNTPQKDTLVIAKVSVNCSLEIQKDLNNEEQYNYGNRDRNHHCSNAEMRETSSKDHGIEDHLKDLDNSNNNTDKFEQIGNPENSEYISKDIKQKKLTTEIENEKAPSKSPYQPKHYNTSEFIVEPLSPTESEAKVCHKELCCYFQSNTTSNLPNHLLSRANIVVYNGHRNFKPEFSSYICAIMISEYAYTDPNRNNKSILPKGVSLPPLQLCAEFTKTSIVYPSIQMTSGMLADEHWQYSEERDEPIPETTSQSSSVDAVSSGSSPKPGAFDFSAIGNSLSASDYIIESSFDLGTKQSCIMVGETLHEVAVVQMYARDNFMDLD